MILDIDHASSKDTDGACRGEWGDLYTKTETRERQVGEEEGKEGMAEERERERRRREGYCQREEISKGRKIRKRSQRNSHLLVSLSLHPQELCYM